MPSFAEFTRNKLKKTQRNMSFAEYTRLKLGEDAFADDIAPVRTTSTTATTNKKEEDEETPSKDNQNNKRTWFTEGLLSDGYQTGDILKTGLAMYNDVLVNTSAGALGLAEKTIDAGASLLGSAGKLVGATKFSNNVKDFVAKDIINEKKVAEIGAFINPMTTSSMLAGKFAYDNLEEASGLGDKTDSLLQSAGDMGAKVALNAVGVPYQLSTAVTSFGGEAENAFKNDATYGEALFSASLSAGLEVALSKLSGGLKFEGKAIGPSMTKALTDKIANRGLKTLAKWGIGGVGEAGEEVLTEIGQRIGQKLSYMDEQSWGEMLSSDEALDSYLESAIGGFVLSGGANSGRVANSIQTGRDYDTGLTENEQKVIDKEVENRIAERETDGNKLTNKEKSEIEDQVISDLEKGYIDVDTIESVLGGETFNTYNSMVERENSLKKEIEALENTPREQITVKQSERLAEAREELKSIDENTKNSRKEQLRSEVEALIEKDTFLKESYSEKARRSQKFEADLSKYDAKQQEVIKRAVDSGILNNTNKTHEFVDLLAKLSADKGVSFDFTNNENLKKSGFALEGVTVNGLVNGKDVILNIEAKKALNTVVGHEITHVLEGTELYNELQSVIEQYATTKGEYKNRFEAISKLYNGKFEGTPEEIEAKLKKELTADLVGDYLFTDSDFINNLSTQKPNIFKKIYEEIKYLYKIATAGSKEARELEKVKRAFDRAYKENNTNNMTKSKFRLDFTPKTDADISYKSLVEKPNMSVSKITTDISEIDMKNRDKIAEEARKRLVEKGLKGEDGAVRIHNKDTDTDIVVGLPGLKHGLDRNYEYTALVSMHLDSYLENAIKINEALPDANRKYDSDIYLGYGETASGEKIPAYFVVSKLTTGQIELVEFGSLYSVRAKKIAEDSTQGSPDFQVRTSADISISDLLDIVNEAYSDVLPKTVAEHYGHGRRKTKLGESVKYSLSEDVNIESLDDIKTKYKDKTDYLFLFEKNDILAIDNMVVKKEYRKQGIGTQILNDVISYADKNGKTITLTPTSEFGTKEKLKRWYKANGFVENKGRNADYRLSDTMYRLPKPNVKYSLSEDSEGHSVSPAVQKRFANSKAVDENGSLKVLYHGTPSGEFTIFDKSKGSIEGDFGSGFYFTDNEADVETNYEGGGPDFENKVARRAEQIEADEDIDYDEAEQRAREELYKGSNKFEVYLNIENPAIVGKTILLDQESLDPGYNPDDFDSEEEYFEQIEQDIAETIGELVWEVEQNVDLYSTDGIADVLFNAYYEGGVGIEDLKARINELYLEDNEGNMAGNEVTRQIIESLGYDGIIDSTVSTKFKNMGMEQGTTHYIVFKPNQIKSITNQNPTDNPDINLSLSDRKQNTAPIGNYNVYGKDIALEAPVRESGVDDIAPVESSEQATEPTNIAPVKSTDSLLYSLEEQQQEQIAEIDNVVNEEDLAEPTELTEVESYDTKLENYQKALEGYKNARETIETSFDEAISKKEAEYNALKRKDTQRASNLLTQIENLKLRKNNNMLNLDSKISKVEETIDKLANGIPTKRQIYHRNIIDKIKTAFTSKGFDFDDVLKKAKDKGTFSSVDNTPQRYIEKSLGYKEGQILNDLTVNKVAQNETEGIKWLNSFTDKKSGLLAQISKEYGIKPRSKESASAQMYAEGFWVDDDGKFIKYGDEELAKDYPDVKVRENIKKLAKDERIRKIYDETLDMINESRKRNLYPEIPRRNNYFLHFREMDDTFSKLGIPFNPNDIRLKDLPTDINGMTADLKPGQPYFASAKQRLGYKTTYDLVGGVEKYLNSAKNQIYHIDDIQTLRALRNYIADSFGQAKGLESLDSMSEEEAIARIEEVYNSHLSTFAKFLNEEANILAGKTSLTDRGLEGVIGRRGIQFLNTVNRQVGSNMVGGNISSALTNTVSIVQAVAKSNKFDAVKAFAQTVNNQLGSMVGKTDGFVENNPLIIRRKGIEKMTRTPWEHITDKGYILASAVDNIASEFIVRTKFNELTRKGMSEQQAHIESDKWASRILGDRSLGQQPHLYNSKMLGLLTKFQLEVRNQLDSQFYDTIQETKVSNENIENGLMRNAKTSAKVASTFFQLAVLQHLYGKVFESVAGYNPAFDIVEVLIQVFGLDDDEESEDTVLDNLEEGFFTLLDDLPYTSTFTGGRIPIASALPVKQLITGKDDYGNEKSRLETLKETAPYYLMPTGYGQIKKTVQGLGMFSEEHPIAGSYTDSGNLRFPVEDTLLNRVQAGMFGQYASENASDYFDNERNPLKEKQIQEFADLDIPIRDYWEYREGLSEQETLEDKFDYIAGLDFPVEKKNIMINNVVDRKEEVDLTNYNDFADYEEFDFATKNAEKYEYLQSINVSYKEYSKSEESKEAYNWAFKNPEKYQVSKAVASDVVTYREYAKVLSSIKADKDENGNTISGSRKEKVIQYIDGLNADYGEKIILFKSEYPSDNTYNEDIIEYLNNREDISYSEMELILKELGFTVEADGTVRW